MGRLLVGLVGFGAIAYIAFCLALWLGQTRLIFYPQPVSINTPADWGLTYEDVQIPVGKGHLHGWWLPHPDPDAKTVLILHGNASNVAGTLSQTWRLLEAGLSALIVDYRGYGRSSGPFPNETRVYEDAAAAWNYLTETRQIAPNSIIIFGHSIGGAIAIDLARHRPQAAGLIVQASFTSMADMMKHVGYSRIVPKWLLNQRFDSAAKIHLLAMPILVIHGTDDATVPPAMSQQLYSQMAEPKQIWLVSGAHHNDIAEHSGSTYTAKLRQWIQALPTGEQSARSLAQS